MGYILVVDDDALIRDLLKEVLTMNGHSVDTADNGKAALELIRSRPYDLVFMDKIMPGLDGFSTVKIIRSTPGLKGLKIIMCTSASVIKDIDEAYAAGADDYIVKPIDIARIIAKVDKHLST